MGLDRILLFIYHLHAMYYIPLYTVCLLWSLLGPIKEGDVGAGAVPPKSPRCRGSAAASGTASSFRHKASKMGTPK